MGLVSMNKKVMNKIAVHIDKGACNSVEYANNFLFSLKLSILCYGLKIVFQKEAENYKQETPETLTIITKNKKI